MPLRINRCQFSDLAAQSYLTTRPGQGDCEPSSPLVQDLRPSFWQRTKGLPECSVAWKRWADAIDFIATRLGSDQVVPRLLIAYNRGTRCPPAGSRWPNYRSCASFVAQGSRFLTVERRRAARSIVWRLELGQKSQRGRSSSRLKMDDGLCMTTGNPEGSHTELR